MRYNLKSLDQESVKILYQHKLNEKLIQENFINVEQYYKYVEGSIYETAEEALGKYEFSKRQKPYWWGKEIEELIKEKRRKYLNFLNTKTDHDKVMY